MGNIYNRQQAIGNRHQAKGNIGNIGNRHGHLCSDIGGRRHMWVTTAIWKLVGASCIRSAPMLMSGALLATVHTYIHVCSSSYTHIAMYVYTYVYVYVYVYVDSIGGLLRMQLIFSAYHTP